MGETARLVARARVAHGAAADLRAVHEADQAHRGPAAHAARSHTNAHRAPPGGQLDKECPAGQVMANGSTTDRSHEPHLRVSQSGHRRYAVPATIRITSIGALRQF